MTQALAAITRKPLTAPKIAACIPGSGRTVASDGATHVLLDPSGAIVHRYSTEQRAIAGAALHNHPDACHTCLHGCACELGQAGCGHWGCWGATTEGSCAFAPEMGAGR